MENPADVDAAIQRALAITDRPIVMDFIVDREENVYPFMPAGKTINETIMRELARVSTYYR